MKTRPTWCIAPCVISACAPQGRAPSAEEYNSVDALIDPMIEDLIARDIIYIDSPDVFEDKYFLSLGHVLAGQAAAEFGMQNDQALAARMVSDFRHGPEHQSHYGGGLCKHGLQAEGRAVL